MKKLNTILVVFFALLQIHSFGQTKDDPIVNISRDSIPFGDVSVGDSYIFSYTLSAENITDDLTVSVIPGQGFRVSDGDGWGYSYTITASAGIIPETILYVKFVPVLEIDYSTMITHTFGDFIVDLPVSGTGIGIDEPYIILNPPEIYFGNVAVGTDSLSEFWYDIKNDGQTSTTLEYPGIYEGFTDESGYSYITSTATSGLEYVLFTPPSEGFFEGNVLITSNASGLTRNVYVSGYGVVPNISINENSYDFQEVEINNYSQEFSYTLAAEELVSDVLISAPFGFEISFSSGTGFTDQLVVYAVEGNVEDTQVFVRFAPQFITIYSGIITHESQYAETKNINISGIGVAVGTAIIYTSQSQLEFEGVEVGSISEEQSYTISGINLVDNIIITAPECFEISETTATGFSNEIILTNQGGTVNNITIYVRFAPQSNQSYTGIISNYSTDATQHNIIVSGDVITGINSPNNNYFKVFPNPSSGVFAIDLPTFNESADIIITNVFGEKVCVLKRQNFKSSTIDLSNQPSGIYFLSLITDSEKYSKKIIIK